MLVFLPGAAQPRNDLDLGAFELVAPRTPSLAELHAFLRHAHGLERVTLAGIAEAAALACDFSLRFPGFAERLVLLDPPIRDVVVPTETVLLVSAQREVDSRVARAFPNRVGPLRDAGAKGDLLGGAVRHLCRAQPRRTGDHTAYVSLGSNLGRREQHLCAAFAALRTLRGVRDVVASRVYETDPVGPGRQDPYLNMVARLATDLEPRALLERLLAIERAQGRERSGVRNEARTLDLDLLAYGDRTVEEADLTVPHPRVAERPFVLEPFRDLAPDLVLPGARVTIAALAAAARDADAVRVREQ